jgi:hypothetical protein
MKMAQHRRERDFATTVPSESVTKRILHSTLAVLALIGLAAVATILAYWSLNNGTMAQFKF